MNSYSSIATDAPLNWFVLIDDQYHGPLSAEDLEHRLLDGSLSTETLAWSDGMSDWTTLRETARFAKVTENLPVLPVMPWKAELSDRYDFIDQATPEEIPEFNIPEMPAVAAPLEPEPVPLVDVPVFPKVKEPEVIKPEQATSNAQAWSKYLDENGAVFNNTTSQVYHPPVVDEKAARMKRVAIGVGAFAAVASIAIAFKLPMFASKPLPLSDELSASDAREINAAVTDHGEAPAVAIAVGGSNQTAPVFFLGTNLKEGSKLEIRIEGRPETLLDRLSVSTRAIITAHGGIAKTPPFMDEQGQPYPRGEYHVSVLCSGCIAAGAAVENSKVLAQKDVFLGGARDKEYDRRLSLYHDKIRDQAVDEVTEIKQVAETLTQQLTETNDEFWRERVLLREAEGMLPGPHTAKVEHAQEAWSTFDAKWKHLEDPMSALFQRWTNDALSTAFVYGNIYSSLKKVGKLTETVHAEQSKVIAKGERDAAAYAKVETLVTQAKAALAEVQHKVGQVANVPTTANGMPQRPD